MEENGCQDNLLVGLWIVGQQLSGKSIGKGDMDVIVACIQVMFSLLMDLVVNVLHNATTQWLLLPPNGFATIFFPQECVLGYPLILHSESCLNI
jgi:hypothetical protein